MFEKWLIEFLYDNFKINYNTAVKKSNFYVGELMLTPAEAAYLLAEFSKRFNISLTNLVDKMDDFSCNELLKAADEIGKKND